MHTTQTQAWIESRELKAFFCCGLLFLLCSLSFDCWAALQKVDTVEELTKLTEETQKIVKNGCYIAGCASALVGTIWAVASQNLKVAASSTAVTVIALKAASFFSGTVLI